MKKRNNRTAKITSIVLFLVAGGAVGYLAGKLGGQAAATVPAPVLIALVILFIPAFFLVIALHEGGHALAGLWMNFDFRMYVVGPFLWDKEVSGWKFKWNKNVNTSGGLVICIPTGTEALGKRFSIYAAGGPIASLCSALFLAGMYLLCSRLSLDSYLGQAVTYFFLLLAFLSAIIFAVTSIPLHAGGFSSDGARIIRLLRGGTIARFELLLLKFTSSTMAGIRPAQLDRAELEEAHTLAKKLEAPMGVYITYYFYQSAMDRQHWEEAEGYLNEYVNEAEAIPEGVRGSVWIEVALFNAMIKRDLATAEMYLNRYKPSALIPLSVEYATRAAIACLKNEREEADHWIIKAQQAMPNMIDRGGALVLQDHLNRIMSMR